MPRTWTCQRQTNGIVCKAENPKRRTICQACGKRRPPSKPAAHLAVLSEVSYEDMVTIRGEQCWLCGAGPGTRRLHRDHDHTTGRMRGLLCFRCNTILPKRVDPDWLRRAADYLEADPEFLLPISAAIRYSSQDTEGGA